jgi:5'-phosphate synthase pdxT subunit
MKIGVLALQGSVKEHVDALRRCGVDPVLVKMPEDLKAVSGLIIPGGESTTIGKLMKKYGVDKAIKKRYKEGMAVYGTCAGAILLAKEIKGSKQPKLGLMDISIMRNAYGRQADSFETEIIFDAKPFKGIFIRSPIIAAVHDGCEILSTLDEKPILVKQGNALVSTFHPELTKDLRVHKYFIGLVNDRGNLLF